MLWGLPAAIVGARLYYVAFQWQDYVTIRLKFLYSKWWLSDLWWSYWWGLALFSLRVIVSFLHGLLDIAAPSVILRKQLVAGGNFMNHEAYGSDHQTIFRKSPFTNVYH